MSQSPQQQQERATNHSVISASSPNRTAAAASSGEVQLDPMQLTVQIWKRELTPSTPFMFHHEYSDESNKNKNKKGGNNNNNNNDEDNDITAALTGYIAPTVQTSAVVEGDDRDSDFEEGGNNNDASSVERLGNRKAMLVEAGAIIDELSPDRGSFKSHKRRAEALRADAHKRQKVSELKQDVLTAKSELRQAQKALKEQQLREREQREQQQQREGEGESGNNEQQQQQQPTTPGGGNNNKSSVNVNVSGGGGNSADTSSSSSPTVALQSKLQQLQRELRSVQQTADFKNEITAHGLENVKCPYRLHSIVSQKDAIKRRRVDQHATSPTMGGMGRITHRMVDSDVAAYSSSSSKPSMKLDREPRLLLAETVIAARGGQTPEEKLNQQVNRFVEKLVNAAAIEEENQIRPPSTPVQWAGATAHKGFSPTVAMRQQNQQNCSDFGHEHFLDNNQKAKLTPTPSKRRPGFAQRLLMEQEHHVVDAMASVMLSKADPPSLEQLQQHIVATPNDALSFVLSADDKHILLTALRFAVSGELFTSGDAEFARTIGSPIGDGKKVLKALASTFDHWNRVCFDKGTEWAVLKRCLAAVTETPISWSSRLHTSRGVHFGNVTQRDLETLLHRLRTDEARKSANPVSERHKSRASFNV